MQWCFGLCVSVCVGLAKPCDVLHSLFFHLFWLLLLLQVHGISVRCRIGATAKRNDDDDVKPLPRSCGRKTQKAVRHTWAARERVDGASRVPRGGVAF